MKISIINRHYLSIEDEYLITQIKTYLILNSHILIDNILESDYIILFTNRISLKDEKNDISFIEKYINKKIIVFGLIKNWFIHKKYRNIIPIFLWDEYLLDNFFYINRKISTVNSIDINNLKNNLDWTFIINISRWCLHNCSYCFFKQIIWNPKSKSIESIIKEFRYALNNWKKYILLSSDDPSSYWVDQWVNFILLLKEIFKIKWNYILNISFIHPSFFIKYGRDFLKLLTVNNNIKELLIPLQSIKPSILKEMKRFYNIELIMDYIMKIRQLWIIVKTHFIVLYPSESYEDFISYIKYLKYFDEVTFNPYFIRKWIYQYNNYEFNTELNKRKIKILLMLHWRYPTKIFLENNFKDLFKNKI